MHVSKPISNDMLQVGRLFAQIAYLPSEKQRVADGSKLASFFSQPCFLIHSQTPTNMKTKTEKKTKLKRVYRVTVRLTTDDLTMFRQKAKKMFGGKISRLIVYAVSLLNENHLVDKYEKVNELSSVYNELSFELKKSGTNLNQAVKQLNVAMLQYGNRPPAAILRRIAEETVEPAVELQADLMETLFDAYKKLLTDIMKAK